MMYSMMASRKNLMRSMRLIHTVARSPSQAIKATGESPVLVYDSPEFKRKSQPLLMI